MNIGEFCMKGKMFVTPIKVRRILRWLVNKKLNVIVIYYSNCSLGYHSEREHEGIVKSFEVSSYEKVRSVEYTEFDIEIEFEDGFKMKESISCDWEFYYLYNPKCLLLKGSNGDGTYDYFKILVKKKKD